MERKEIQEQRVRTYFIEATKEILKGEGLKCVNARNISERAGYSYATLYNYFKDIKDLIFECVKDFQEECTEIVRQEVVSHSPGIKRIPLIVKSYIRYFIQYPGTFELFFLEKTSDISSKPYILEMIYNFLDRLCEDDWKHLIDEKELSDEEVDLMKSELRFTVTGLLLFYNNRRQPPSYSEFSKLVDRLINRILKQ